MKTGKQLRGMASSITDTALEIQEELREKDQLTPKAEQLLENVTDASEDLFYEIPFKEEEDG